MYLYKNIKFSDAKQHYSNNKVLIDTLEKIKKKYQQEPEHLINISLLDLNNGSFVIYVTTVYDIIIEEICLDSQKNIIKNINSNSNTSDSIASI